MRLRHALAVAGLAMAAAVTPVTAASAVAAPASVGVQQVMSAPSCVELLQRIADLEARLEFLQDQLRHAAPQDKPRIIRQILAVQNQIAEAEEQLATCV